MSTGTKDRVKAEAWLRQALKPGGQLFERSRRPGDRQSFAAAAEDYANAKSINLTDPQGQKERAKALDIKRLIKVLGKRPVVDLTGADLRQAATRIFPVQQAETKNRHVMKPGSAIIRMARETLHLPLVTFRLFQEKEPVIRAAASDDIELLLAKIPAGPRASAAGSSKETRRLLVLWCYLQGNRISDILTLTWDDHIKLAHSAFCLFVGKTQKPRNFALHPKMIEALAAIPEEQRTGKLFPWKQKSGVYRWLRPLTAELGIRFTPHMGRHSLGTRLNAAGIPTKSAMEILGHADVKSTMRYQSADVQIQSRALHDLDRHDRARR
jgi:integrase